MTSVFAVTLEIIFPIAIIYEGYRLPYSSNYLYVVKTTV